MTVALTSPVTGTAQTGLTSPTYSVAQDNNPDTNGKQWYVTAVGGTQTGVTAHSASDPFTVSFWKPKVYKIAQMVTSAVFKRPPRNTYKAIVRKGVTFNATQPKDIAIISLNYDVPQGAEALSQAELRAALSLLIGAVQQQSAGLGDTVVTGAL